jgi:hypothetical protein
MYLPDWKQQAAWHPTISKHKCLSTNITPYQQYCIIALLVCVPLCYSSHCHLDVGRLPQCTKSHRMLRKCEAYEVCLHFFSKASAPAMGPTGSLYSVATALLSPRAKCPEREVDHLHLVPRLRWVGLYRYPTYISHLGVDRKNVTCTLFRELLLICLHIHIPCSWQYNRYPNTPTNFTGALQYRF